MANTIEYNQTETFGGTTPLGGAMDSILGTGLTLVNPLLGAAYNVGSGLFKAIQYPFQKKKAEEMSGHVQTVTSEQSQLPNAGRLRGVGEQYDTTEIRTDYEVAKPWGNVANNAVGAVGGLMLGKDNFDELGSKLDDIFKRDESISSGIKPMVVDNPGFGRSWFSRSVDGNNQNITTPDNVQETIKKLSEMEKIIGSKEIGSLFNTINQRK